ncbi:hypothetical protein BH10ACT9_BH10ACT9_50820 [soil metagenome]
MTGDLRSSILTTAAVAVSVAGLTVIQPLTAAPPLLLAALLMDGDTADYTGLADTISGKLLPADGKAVVLNFLTGPFGIWNALEGDENHEDVVPSTALGIASSLPFMAPPVPAGALPPAMLPAVVGPPLPTTVPAPLPVYNVDVPTMEIGDPTPVKPPVEPTVPPIQPVVTSFGYDLGSYATATLINPFAWTNAVAAYLERTLTGAVVPVNPDGSVGCGDDASECHVPGGVISQFTDEDGVKHVTFTTDQGKVVEATVETRNGVTYVTYDDDGALPLVRPLRDYGGLLGNELADVLEPALTALVYWGYRDAAGENDNLFLPSMADTIRAVLDFIVGVKEGLESLLEPHDAAPTTAALAAPAEDADVDDATPEVTAPEPVDETSSSPTPEPSTPEPLDPAPISVEDAVHKLTDLFHKPLRPEKGESDVSDEDTTVDEDTTDDTDTDEADTDTDDEGVTAPDKADDDDNATDDSKDSDADKPDRVKGGPNKASSDDSGAGDAKDSAAE